jgi:hypothetical protein
MIVQAFMMNTTNPLSSINELRTILTVPFYGEYNVKILDISSYFNGSPPAGPTQDGARFQKVSLFSDKLKITGSNSIEYLQRVGNLFALYNYSNADGTFCGSEYEFKKVLLDGYIDFKATFNNQARESWILITMDIEKA